MGWAEMLVHGPAVAVETLGGPYYDPARSYPPSEVPAAQAAAGEFEQLLHRQVDARAWSLLYAPALGAVLATVVASASPPSLWWVPLAFFAGVVIGLLDFLIGSSAPYPMRSATRVVVAVLGPGLPELRRSAEQFHDLVMGLSELNRVAFLQGLSASGHRLAAQAVKSSWTLVPSHLKQYVL